MARISQSSYVTGASYVIDRGLTLIAAEHQQANPVNAARVRAFSLG